MKIGVDGRKLPEASKRGPLASFDHAKELGMAGIFFRTILEMSPTLDRAMLRDIRDKADSLGMYLETGIGKVNPYSLPETPEVRQIGDGDTILGFRRMMEACAAIGCTELWSALANYKVSYVGKFACDRFRTDVAWKDQLEASEKLLKKLAPIARDLGVYINLETHEESTTFEILRLVEAVGPDAVGVVFDTSNILQRTEHPVFAAQRIAPYVRQTHIKDALIGTVTDGIECQKRPCGEGVVDFSAILPILARSKPDLHLSIENDESYTDRPRKPVRIRIDLHDSEWRDAHPDLTNQELEAFMELVQIGNARIQSGSVRGFSDYAQLRPGYAETVDFIKTCAAHLRVICAEKKLPLTN